jgi:hypothetical protein
VDTGDKMKEWDGETVFAGTCVVNEATGVTASMLEIRGKTCR